MHSEEAEGGVVTCDTGADGGVIGVTASNDAIGIGVCESADGPMTAVGVVRHDGSSNRCRLCCCCNGLSESDMIGIVAVAGVAIMTDDGDGERNGGIDEVEAGARFESRDDVTGVASDGFDAAAAVEVSIDADSCSPPSIS